VLKYGRLVHSHWLGLKKGCHQNFGEEPRKMKRGEHRSVWVAKAPNFVTSATFVHAPFLRTWHDLLEKKGDLLDLRSRCDQR
jgi:hypothetical protein